MKALLIKELKSVFCSLSGAFFSLSYLLVAGVLLWGFAGSYNILDGGYVSMNSFFSLSAFLFILLIPALTMRSFSEERKAKTLDILRTRPITTVSIYFSKYIALIVFAIVTLLPTLVYVWSLSSLAYPSGNIDYINIAVSYLSLLLLLSVFVAVGVFASSVTSNQVVAFILAVLLSASLFYGFELVAQLFLSGKTQLAVSSLGLYHHYSLMQKGVVELSGLICILGYLALFVLLVFFVLGSGKAFLGMGVGVVLLVNILFVFMPNIRFDFTEDKRYSISDYSKHLLSDIGKKGDKIKVDIWLDGDLNTGFQFLQNNVKDLFEDFNSYADNAIEVRIHNPYMWYKTSAQMYESMAKEGMNGIVLNEVDREGKTSQKIIYPYAQVSDGKDTLIVSFLKNIKGNTAQENLNASVEALEYEFIDAIRLLRHNERKDIAFVEGHGELPRSYVYDAEELLSKYYFVNRGQIDNQVGVLDNFAAIIIAGPTKKYSETEKYILDQYLMSGGKILWLVDGAYYSHDDLEREGVSASIKNETNLDDLLFTYGVRINPDFVQDKQSRSVYLMSGDDTRSSVLYPCYYMPLLIPSADHPVTKDIRDVMSVFTSSIDFVNNNAAVEKKVLLTTSGQSHLVKVPEFVDLKVETIQDKKGYFDKQYIATGVSLEGNFPSAYYGRMSPDSIIGDSKNKIDKSKKTKMIVVSSSQVISNEIEGKGNNSQIVPMGFDKVSNTQFGNRDFIINAVNWLTDDAGLMSLRSKQQKIRIFDKQLIYEKRNLYTLINILFPTSFMLVVMGAISLHRRRKYRKF